MKILLSLTLLVLAQTVYSAEGDTSTGCGLGWSVTKSMTTTAAITRASTNATFSNTFAMTSGTSGCAKHDIVKNDRMDLHFVEANHELLIAEAAIGDGEYLNGLTRALGCNNNGSRMLKEEMQKNYEQIFTVGQPAVTSLGKIKAVIQSKLQGYCQLNS